MVVYSMYLVLLSNVDFSSLKRTKCNLNYELLQINVQNMHCKSIKSFQDDIFKLCISVNIV